MVQKEPRDWKNEVSKQIAVYKTDKKLLELNEKLKPASKLFPAHIHAMGEDAEEGARSLIQLVMLDYSNGTGDNTLYVSAHINPEEARFLFSRIFCGLLYFEYQQEKIFGEPDEDGFSIVTKLSVKRYDTDTKGQKRRYPWITEIQNGRGIAVKNANGGTHCQKESYICDALVSININDVDMFQLFAKADAYIRAFEQEHAFRSNLLNNFNKLYQLLKREIQGQTNEIVRHIEHADETDEVLEGRKAS
ncbi:MAG: hypothetical protein LBT06_10415 [Hungatella sp.]|jgi:hypothetical protein|nr:hypothetical protein [Hungatella sp.]